MRIGRGIITVIYTWLIITLGFWSLARLCGGLDLDRGREYLLLVAFGVLAEWLAVNFPQGRLSAGFAVVLAAFLVYGVPAAAWIGTLAVLFGQGVVNRGNPLRATLFNGAQHVLALMGGNVLFRLAGGRLPSNLSWQVILPILLFALGYFLVNHLLVYLFLLPGQRFYPMFSWRDTLRWDLLIYVFCLPFGMLTAVLYGRAGMEGETLLFIPLLIVQFVLRLYVHTELSNRELTALYRVAGLLNERLNVKEIVELILNETRRVVPYHAAVIYLWDEKKGRFTAAAAAGARADELRASSLERGEGFIGRVMASGRAEIIFDTRLDHRVRGEPGLFQVCRSLLIIPLQTDAGVAGVFVLGDKRRQAFDDNHRQLLSIMAGQAAVAVANAMLVRRLEESANTDGLTGIYNHRYFLHRAAEDYRSTQSAGLPLALIMLDVDSFKTINDRYGHPAGDAVLVELARLLRDAVGEAGTVARYGGEEFAVLLPGFDAQRAGSLAEALRRLVREHEFQVENIPRQVRVSLGVAVCPTDAADVTALIRRADQALYRAKEKGRDRVVLAADLLKPGNN